MPEASYDYKTRQQPFDPAGVLAPLPPAAIAWRRRALRWCAFLTFVGGVGLNLAPGPKGSEDTVSYVDARGAAIRVHKFTFNRPYGMPFVVARAEIGDAGEIKNLKVNASSGIVGNFAVAFAASFALLALIGRRRRQR